MTVYNQCPTLRVKQIMRFLLSLLLLIPLAAAAQQTANPASPPSSAEDASIANTPVPTDKLEPTPLGAAGPEYALVDLLGSKEQTLEIQSQLINTLVRTSPNLQDYQSTVQAWARQYLNWNEVRERLAAMYRDNFTPGELDDLLAFYRSPTGRKSVLLMPTLLRESSQIGIDLAAAHRPELIDMLGTERARKASAITTAPGGPAAALPASPEATKAPQTPEAPAATQ